MTDRELMQMALDAMEKIIVGCGYVKEEKSIHADAKSLATQVRKDCFGITRDLQNRLDQPEREWVGFTHEELAWLNEALNLGGRFAVIEAIEAKLKEKNNG
jgi:hypothetical protein